MMTSQVLRFVDFTKSQKPRYLENETSYPLQIKEFIKSYFMAKNSFVVEGSFRFCHLKVKCLDLPMKIGNLAILLLNCCCEKLSF